MKKGKLIPSILLLRIPETKISGVKSEALGQYHGHTLTTFYLLSLSMMISSLIQYHPTILIIKAKELVQAIGERHSCTKFVEI